MLLYDEFDVWEVKPDGSGARMITAGEGRKQHLAFRYRPLDPEQTTVPTNAPLLLSATNDDTRATGFYRASFTGTAALAEIVMLDKAFGPVTKAEKADTVVFTLSRFEEFPNLWVSDTTFKNMQKVSDANPQQSELVWGTSELIDYINADGKTAPRDSDEAGELRSEEEVSAHGLHLRGADAGAVQLLGAQRRHEHQHPALRQQRLRRAASGHRLHDRATPEKRPRSA